jgi:hypothetical protein
MAGGAAACTTYGCASNADESSAKVKTIAIAISFLFILFSPFSNFER